MNWDTLFVFFDEHYKNIEKRFGQLQRKAKMKAIHKLRTSVRRITACMRLLQYIESDFAPDQFIQDIRPVFKQAGRVRDLQVSLELIMNAEESQMPEEVRALFLAYSEFKINEYSSNLMAGVAQANIEVLQNARILLDNWTNNPLEHTALLQAKLTEDALALAEREVIGLEEEQVHEVRLLVKTLRYSVELYLCCTPANKRLLDVVVEVRNMHKLMGLWHDFLILRDNILACRRFQSEKKSKRILKKSLKHVLPVVEQLRERINIQWPGVVNRLRKISFE